jgi:hypothetical protein
MQRSLNMVLLAINLALLAGLTATHTERKESRALGVGSRGSERTEARSRLLSRRSSRRIEGASERSRNESGVHRIPESEALSRDGIALLFSGANVHPVFNEAHEALGGLCQQFQLRNPDGTEIEFTYEWRGEGYCYYAVQAGEVETVARLLHEMDPELLSAAQLEQVRESRLSREEWFERLVAFRD